MSSVFERVYSSLPYSLQNVAMSLRGWYLARNRYTKTYRQYFDDLMRSQWLSAEQFRDLQTAELRKLIKEAAQNVPYYRKTLGKFLNKIDSLTLDNLKDIPMIEKSFLRSNVKEFTNPERLKYGYDESHTSGTTGSPLTILYDFDSMQYNEAFRERQYRWSGTTGSEASVRFSGHLILGRHSGPPFWRYNAAQKQWFFSTYHMTDENLGYYADKLAQIQPVYFDGYPSALYVLARWIKSHNRVGEIRPWSVITTAETLLWHQKELIEDVFGCRVFDYYSSSEGAPYITQCGADGHHINPESGIVEILRPDGSPANDGEIGEMVVTSFFQRTVPLIRYRIGDTAIVDSGVCPCGHRMPLVKSVTGRLDDLLWTEERGYVGRLDLVYKTIPSSIKEAQIVQTLLDEVELRYVPDGQLFQNEHLQKVIEQLKARLGQNIKVRPVEMPEIPRGGSGKFRTVVREVDLPNVGKK